ncbi:glucosyltransferase domain-containing protein [Ruegeria arenilitoris]|uniref:glucosyltransferase domain-containing protein n=1 Tax=Ruegeria arenilitoris TaxID=1173585 RepID=UPI00147A214E|nr:glucosyltransferase domain-containing protein [Ruegeria arenilitoris]
MFGVVDLYGSKMNGAVTDAKVPFWAAYLTAAILTALIFLPTAGIGIAQSGFNPDEWRFAAGLDVGFAEVHGRWATHWAHEVIFRWGTPIALLIFITFVALFAVSVLIAHSAVAPVGPAMITVSVLLIFLAGSSHIYLTAILHWETQAPWFCLGLLASVGAMILIVPALGTSSWSLVLRVLVAAELLAISIGFYQSYTLLGFLIPAMVLIRVDRHSHRESLLYLCRVLVASVIALVLYQFQLRATISILDLSPNFRFSGSVDRTVLYEKLSALLRVERKVHSGALMGMLHPYRGIFLLTTAAACGMILMAAASALRTPYKGSGGGWFGAFRVLLGGFGTLFILPVLIWFLYPEPFLIPRSIGFLGFVVVGVILACTTVIAQGMAKFSASRLVWAGGSVLVLTFGLVHATASSHIWTLFQRVAEQDVDLANAIVERAQSIDDFDVKSTPIRTFGHPTVQNLQFGRFYTASTFQRGMDVNSIFQTLYGATDFTGSVLAPPKPCTAFPEEGSVFMVEDTLFVCFEASVPLSELSTCFPLGAGRNGALCYSGNMAILLGQTCADIDPGSGQIVATQFDDVGARLRQHIFYSQAKATEMNGFCYRFVDIAGRPFSAIRIESVGAEPPGKGWGVEYKADDARTQEAIFPSPHEPE